MKEQNIQTKVIKYLESQGCYTVKVIRGSRAGVPDVLACCNGMFFGFEIKKGKNKSTPLQIHNAELIRRAGGIAVEIHSLTELQDALANIGTGAPLARYHISTDKADNYVKFGG